MRCKTLTIVDDGKISKVNVNIYPNENMESKYECKYVADDTILLSYNDFMNKDMIILG